ncbi:MAG TPA: FG-GAP-like repeat-containing protein, partial [Vicinamibacterales bacterium]|nr:FG-GAP-like repeat-containing protein [Vicinamibacterales bacterium]
MRIRPLAALCALVAAVVSPGAQAPGAAGREAAYRASNVGVALLEQFDYEAAAASFRQALESDATLHAARLNLAIALLYGGDVKAAAGEASTAADRLPRVPNAHYVLGLARRSLDELDAAVAAFRRVLEIDPADAGARVNLGQIALQRREYDVAIDLFRGALEAEPYNVTAAYNLALALTRSGKADEGRKAMTAFETLRDSLYGVTYAQTYLAQGKYSEAIVSTGAEPALVDPATPSVTFSDATSASLPSPAAQAPAPGGIALFDADDDGDLDAMEAAGSVQRFLRNDRGTFTDETIKAGLAPAGPADRTGAAAADYDNDGRIDVLVLRSGGPVLLRQNASGAFEDATRSAGLSGPGGSTAAFADVDHDGDLDIVLPGSPSRLFRNSGNGTFGDIAVQAG